MKKRKKEPYIDIIDLKTEQKEYADLCNGKSKKFQTYTSWESHIKSLLLKFDSPSDLYNFKRYCINKDRVSSNAPDLFGSCVVLMFTIILDNIDPYLPLFVVIPFGLYFVYHMIKQQQTIIKESCFFKDIVEIIDEIEKEKADT